MKKLLSLGVALGLLLTASHALAASATWNSNPTDGNWVASGGENNWSTGANTSPGLTTGATSSDTATFTSSSVTAITINNANLNIGGITFGSGASALSNFTIGSTSGSSLFLNGGGNITFANGTSSNNVTETVNAPLVFRGTTYTLSNANLNSTNVLNFGGAISSGTNTAVALTLTGSNTGANTISGAITDGTGTVSLSKTGSGTWILTGSNNYSGITTITGGILTVTNTHGLGSSTSAAAIDFTATTGELNLLNDGTGNNGTIIFGPGNGYNVTSTRTGTINVDHNTSSNTGNTVQLGTATNSSSLVFTNGDGYNLTFAGGGAISGNSGFTNNMTSGTLTFTGGIVDTSTVTGAQSLTFSGTGSSATTVVAGISMGASTNTLSLLQSGQGTLVLTGPSNYIGSTTITEGAIVLNNSTGAAVTTSSLTLGGGIFSDIGSSSTAPTFATGTTAISAGSNTVSTGSTTGHVLALGSLARAISAGVVNFTPFSTTPGANGSITTLTGNTNGIIGGWATVNGSDWAAVSGTTITAYGGYTTLSSTPSGTFTSTNFQLANGSGTTTLSSGLKANSLKITDSGTTSLMNLGANALSFNAGEGLLYTGGGSYTINGTGFIGAGTSSGAEFFANVNSTSTLTINAPLIGSGGSGILTKDGAGTLILTATNSGYGQATNILGGIVEVTSLANSGSTSSIGSGSVGGNSAANLVIDGGTLAYIGSGSSTNRNFTIGSNGGEIDASGTGALVMTGTMTDGAPAVGLNTLTLGGTNTGANTISSPIANLNGNSIINLTKTGAGTWVLSGSNSYTGATTVNAGTLSISGSLAAGSPVAVNGGTLAVTGTVGGAISVAHGATLSGAGGTIGALTLAGGGIINTQDGAIGTLNGTTLTLNPGGGNAALDLDLGSSQTADLLSFSGAALLNNNFTVNVIGLGTAGTGTYTIATASGGLVAADFTAGTLGGTVNGDSMSFVLSGNSIELIISGGTTSPNYYFTGANSGSFTDPGNYNTLASGGASQTGNALSSTSNVFLDATSPAPQNTPPTLNTSASINSLTFLTGGESLAGTGTLTVAATGTAGITDSAGNSATTETIAPSVVLGSNQSWVATANSTLNVTGSISGAQSLALTGAGTYKLGGANTYSGGTAIGTGSDSPTVLLTNGSNGSATGTGSLTVNAGATLGGTGTSSGTSFAIVGTGTTTATRAQVLAGLNSKTDTSVGTALTLKGTAAATIADANLTFNISSTSLGASSQLNVGTTAVAFGAGVQSTTLSLNVQGSNFIPANTGYILIAGTDLAQTSAATSQYSGLTFGTSTGSLATGLITPILNSGNGGLGNLVLSLSGTAAGNYGANSYLFLYQDSFGVDDIEVEVVPEPGTWALMLGGLAFLMFWQRRRNKN